MDDKEKDKEQENLGIKDERTVENMIRWAKERLGSKEYAGWCLSFIEDGLHAGCPEKVAFVFYDCLCLGKEGPVNWGTAESPCGMY